MKITVDGVLLWIIKLTIVSLFIVFLYLSAENYNFLWHFDSFNDFLVNLKYREFLNSLFRLYRSVIFLLIPLFGVFLNKSLGWICLTSYFYFIFANILFQLISSDLDDILWGLTAMMVGIIPILIMNRKGIYFEHYRIDRARLLMVNVYASILGIAITLLLAYSNS